MSAQANLDAEFPFSFVLAAGERILLQGSSRWQLLDAGGRSLKLGKLGAGDAVMDPANGVFYVVDPFGVLEAHRLADGEVDYSVSISGGEEWVRSFYARMGHKFAIVSFQREIQPHSAISPSAVTVDVEDLGNPPAVEQHIVVSAKQESRLYYAAARASGALVSDTLVVAIKNQVIVTQFGKTVRAILEDTFAPGPLSLDESGRIYLLVSRGQNRTSLWVLTQAGERVGAFDAPENLPLQPMPPVVGYDHKIYLVSGDRVLCLSPDGTLLWQKPAAGIVAGLAAIPSGGVLVSSGNAMVRFSAQGEQSMVHEFPGEVLKTPPAMTKDGDLVVASGRHLYRLTTRPRG